jgi:choline-sulfatase
MSDQHTASFSGFGGSDKIRTPHMDRLAQEGTVFDAAYTSNPLCVPARMSFLTGRLSESTGIYTNSGALSGDDATFLHALGAQGYDTVLVGRMHFMGNDQRHGFSKRLVGDMTPTQWGQSGSRRKDLGGFVRTLGDRYLEVVGGGDSPVQAYDRAVAAAAIEYLNQDHGKPQCVVVGLYGPHYPYVAPPELYRAYAGKAPMPVIPGGSVPDDLMQSIRAAYCGMITQVDSQLGEVRQAWDNHLTRQNRKGVFFYTSDHGDMAGERGLFGKSVFFEGSARIPMIAAGDGIRANARVRQPVSLIDLAPTVCELTGSGELPACAGQSLVPQLAHGLEDGRRAVVSEAQTGSGETAVLGRMLRKGPWKLISYANAPDGDRLYHIENDPHEQRDLTAVETDAAAALKRELSDGWDIPAILAEIRKRDARHALLDRWGTAAHAPEERWPVPEHALAMPER